MNYLPVRAYPAHQNFFNSLVREMEAQHRASVPHQDLGCLQITRNCTDWPSWTRLGSVIIYQNHGSSIREFQGSSFSNGDMECDLSACGPATDATDVSLTAEPEEHVVNILVQYIPSVISLEQAERLMKSLRLCWKLADLARCRLRKRPARPLTPHGRLLPLTPPERSIIRKVLAVRPPSKLDQLYPRLGEK